MHTRTAPQRIARTLLSILAGLSLLWTGQSCVFDDSATVECESGLRCPAGSTCALNQDVCIEGGCGDGLLDIASGETCDDGNITDDDGCSSDCKLENCGDGLLQPGEVCDDGNAMNGDGCSSDCLSDETCGNGYVDVGEVCDDGDTMSTGDGCRGDCSGFEMCGNGTVDVGEQCDNGGINDMVCDSDCTFRVCGDGHVNTAAGETCDPGMGTGVDSATCDGNCSAVQCGDGYTNTAAGEMCDTSGDSLTCDSDCTPRACGDSYVNTAAGETCDDGNGVLTDDCPDGPMGTCVAATCGDGFVQAGVELCDDGGDSMFCDGDCTFPECGDGYVNAVAGETCEDENGVNTDACPDGVGGTCQTAVCGDTFVRTGVEDCDDGGDSATCDGDCTFVACGDNYVNGAAGETCDDGNNNNRDACPTGVGGTCVTAFCGDGFTWDQDGGTEDCDTGGDSATCDSDCTPVVCGDLHVNTVAGEQCDDGDNGDNTDACVDSCVAATCGDGHVWAGMEVCDRGGNHAECDGDCTLPACGDGYPNPAAGETCDDGNNNDNDNCPDNTGNCQTAFCGDGFVNNLQGTEQCDPGNGLGNDSASCDSDCTPVACGDGYTNATAGEDCDLGNADPDAGCVGLETCQANCTCG